MVAQTTAASSDANNGLRPMARTGQTGPLGKLCNIVSVTLAHNDNTKNHETVTGHESNSLGGFCNSAKRGGLRKTRVSFRLFAQITAE